MATPNDLVTNWNAWTLVVLASEPGDGETDGAGLTTDGDERADGLGSGAEVVQDAAISTPISRPAKRIFDGTGGTPLGQATLAHEGRRLAEWRCSAGFGWVVSLRSRALVRWVSFSDSWSHALGGEAQNHPQKIDVGS